MPPRKKTASPVAASATAPASKQLRAKRGTGRGGRAAGAAVVTSPVAANATAPAPKQLRAKRGTGRGGKASGAAVVPVADEVFAIPVNDAQPSNDMDSQLTLCFDDGVVQHDIVLNDGIRARNNTHRCKQVLPTSHFHELANQAAANFEHVLMNACIHYQPPLIGDVECAFEGKIDQEGDEIITAGDVVAFRWSYKCAVGNGIVVDGICKTEQNTRQMNGSAPRPGRSIMVAAQIAKLYDLFSKINPADVPFMAKYCARKNSCASLDGCKICCFGFPKPATKMPRLEKFVDSSGKSARWLICAVIDAQGKHVLAHPGPLNRYSTNQCVYNLNELRVFDRTNNTEMVPEVLKKRKRSAEKGGKDRCLPMTLMHINEGKHRGCRDALAYAQALAEFERAEVEGRDASLDVAFAGFDSDPFKFDRHPVTHLFAFWRSAGDGRLHVQSGSLRYFFSLAVGRNPK